MMVGNGEPHEEEQKSDRTKAREAFFLEFAKVIRKEFPDVPLMVTGGFCSRGGMEQAVAEGACDLVGLGRPAALNPSIPNNIVFNPEVKDQDATVYRKKVTTPWIMKQIGLGAIGAGMDSVCFVSRMTGSLLTVLGSNGIRQRYRRWQSNKHGMRGRQKQGFTVIPYKQFKTTDPP